MMTAVGGLPLLLARSGVSVFGWLRLPQFIIHAQLPREQSIKLPRDTSFQQGQAFSDSVLSHDGLYNMKMVNIF